MRLLIYLLALISGFSAAEAALADVSPASSVAQTSVAAVEVLVSQEHSDTSRPADRRPWGATICASASAPLALATPSPVLLHDLTRE